MIEKTDSEKQKDRKIRLQGLLVIFIGLAFFCPAFAGPYRAIKNHELQISYNRTMGTMSIACLGYGAVLVLSGLSGRRFFNRYILSKPFLLVIVFMLLAFFLYALGMVIDIIFYNFGYAFFNLFVHPQLV